MTAIIEVEGLTKSYGSKRGITNVSFQVEEGEVFGFLGPNGAGKTTTIRLLMALLRADEGKAHIAGLDSWEKSVEIKRLGGYLPGEPALDPNLTGGQILEYFGHLRGGVDQSYLKQLIKRLDLDPSRKFRLYSSGNKRKVVLSQAWKISSSVITKVMGWLRRRRAMLILVVLSSFPSLVETATARASLVSLGPSFAWIAEPFKIDTPGGYATFKYGFTVLIMALWPLLACSRMLRGEEERGSMDVLLSMPRGRGRVALEKLAAMWTALVLMGLLIGLLTYIGGMRVNADFSFGDAILSGLNLSLVCGVFGSLALLISQFTQERGAAAGWTGGLLLIFIVLDMVHRVIPDTDWISHLSPIYYYNLNKPLVPGFGINPGALLVLLALSIILSGAAIWLFVGRDIGGTVKLPGWLRLPERAPRAEQALPVNAWSLRSVYARGLGMMIVPAIWWTIAIAGCAAWMVVIVKQTESQLATIAASSPILRDLLNKVGGGDIGTNATILSALFTFMPLLLMAFAVTQVNRWAADEEDGRLEMVLATPQPRLNVLLARFAALTTVLVIMGFITLAATELSALAAGLKLDGGNVAAASLGMIPLGLLIAALGFLFSRWLRTAIDTGLLSFLLVIWFFITFVGPELNWPENLQKLTAFYYYGTPLLHGLSVGNMLLVLAVAVVALALASVRLMCKDIGR